MQMNKKWKNNEVCNRLKLQGVWQLDGCVWKLDRRVWKLNAYNKSWTSEWVYKYVLKTST